MLAGIVAFEWRYTTRRLTFAITAGGYALMGFALAATEFGPASVQLNGTWSITYSVGFLTLLAVIAATLLSAPALLRDSEHRMAEIVYASSVTRRDYLLGRFLGSSLAVGSAFACGLAGLVAGAFAMPHDPARIAPFQALPYLWAAAVLALPGILFVAAFLFAVAALTRSTAATYVAGVFLYVLYFAAALFTDSPLLAGSAPQLPQRAALAARLDPFGLAAFFQQTEYWTVGERNTRLVALSGPFLQNRLLWLAVAALVLAFAYRRFAFRLAAGREASVRDEVEELPTSAPPYRPAPAGVASQWPALFSTTRLELRALLGSWPLGALLLLWVANTGIEIAQTCRSAELGTALVPTTGLLVGTIAGSLDLFGILVLVYFGTEIVWRERAVRMSEVVDATPASNAVFLAAKGAALAAVLLALVACGVGVAVLFQLASGYHELEPLLYASLLYFGALPLALLAVLALFLQSLAPHRHVGLLLTLAAAAVLHRGAFGGPDHLLLRYAAAPEVPYSALRGFGPGALTFGWSMAYWTAFAALLALVTGGIWRRGTDPRLPPRLAALPARWGRGGRRAALACGLLFLSVGALAYRRTNVWNRYETDRALAAWKADYETKYRPLAELAQPVVTDLRATIDLEPTARRCRVHGRYRLTNPTDEAIGTVWIVVRRDVAVARLRIAGSPPREVDPRFGVHRFALAHPLEPGAGLDVDFDLTVERRGPKADGEELDLVANGSFVVGQVVLPSVGYRRSYELVDPAARRRAGLPARSGPESAEGDFPVSLSRMTFATTVSTPEDQLAVAPGVLLGSVVENGRRLSRFAATSPVSATFAVAAARYAVERRRHAGVDLEVYHHPEHRRNAGRILEAAARALDLCVARYGPYPFPQLRLAEVPAGALRAAGLALPGVIYLAEDRAFLTDASDPARIDLVTKRVAHEVAHQWWGHQLAPAPGPGSTALVETLARHTELRVLADRHGAAALRPVLEFELDRYLTGRAAGDEVPLVDVGDQAYLYYAKGSLVMAGLVELLGEAAVDGALRDLLRATATTGRAPTSRELLARLLDATPAEHRELVREAWTRVALYDVRVTAAKAGREPDGRWRVDLSVAAEKTDGTDGREVTLPFDAELRVTVYAAHPGPGRDGGAVLSSSRHRVSAATDLSLLVDGRPAYVAVDPGPLRLDRNRADDLRRIDGRP